jgi:hypothetical protein
MSVSVPLTLTEISAVNGDELLIQTAYLTAAYLAPNQSLPGVDPICSSSDCDWPIYGSLGICAETVNISATTNSSLLAWLQEVFFYELEHSQYSTVFRHPDAFPRSFDRVQRRTTPDSN